MSADTDTKESDEKEQLGGLLASDFLNVGTLPFLEQKDFYMDEENIQKNGKSGTWTNCDATTFDVREGPDYNPKSKKKAPSGKSLYNVFAIDTYNSSQKISKIFQFVNLTNKINELNKTRHEYSYEKWPLPPIIIINFMIPNYAPSSYFGSSSNDGEGFSLIVYAEMNNDTRDHLEKYYNGTIIYNDLIPQVKLFANFLRAKDAKDEDEIKGKGKNKYGLSKKEIDEMLTRFKIIVRLMNYSHTQLPYAMTPIVNKYNGKPFLAKTSSTFYHEQGKYFAVDVDAHLFGRIARNSLNYVRPCLDTLIYDGGFVIEGRSNDELPEQLLMCARINKVGPSNTKSFPDKLLKEYIRRTQINKHRAPEMDVNSNNSVYDLKSLIDNNNDDNNNNNNESNNNNNTNPDATVSSAATDDAAPDAAAGAPTEMATAANGDAA